MLYEGSHYSRSYGGLTPEIAQLTNDEIREYHGRYYHPENISIVVQGCVDTERLLDALANVDMGDGIVGVVGSPFHDAKSPVYLPWMEEIPPLVDSKVQTIRFPSDDESVGSITMGWRGPHIQDTHTLTALSVLTRYLNGNTSSPLPQEFVHISSPLANNISFFVQEVKSTKLVIEFSGVPFKKEKESESETESEDDEDGEGEEEEEEGDEEEGDEEEGDEEEEKKKKKKKIIEPNIIYNRLIKLLNELKENGLGKELMNQAIDREKVKIYEGYEEDPMGMVFGTLLSDICFPPHNAKTVEEARATKKDISTRFDMLESLDKLVDVDRSFWVDLLDRYILNAHHVEAIMVPDRQLAVEMGESTKNRLAERCLQLKEEGLKQKDEYLKACIESNKSFPESFRSKLPATIPPIKNIPMIPLTVGYEYSEDWTIQKVGINTRFPQIYTYFYLQELPGHLRPYLTIFNSLLFETDIVTKDGTRIDYKEVCELISRETVSLEGGCGFSSGVFSCWTAELFRVVGTCEPTEQGVQKLVHWMTNCLFNMDITKKRLVSVVNNLLTSLNETSRDSSSVCTSYSAYQLIGDTKNSNEGQISIYEQKHFLTHLKAQLKQDKEEPLAQIVANILGIQQHMLSNPYKMFVQIAYTPSMPFETINTIFTKVWKEQVAQHAVIGSLSDVRRYYEHTGDNRLPGQIEFFSPLARHPVRIPATTVAHQVEIKSSETNNMTQMVDFPIKLVHADYAPSALLCDLFHSKEGEIRSKGYAYGNSLTIDTTKSIISFSITDATNPVKALECFHKFLIELPAKINELAAPYELETTVSTEVYDFYSTKTTPSEVIYEAHMSLFKGLPSLDSDINLLARFQKVTAADILTVYHKYFKYFIPPCKRTEATVGAYPYLNDHAFYIAATNPSSSATFTTQFKSEFDVQFKQTPIPTLFKTFKPPKLVGLPKERNMTRPKPKPQIGDEYIVEEDSQSKSTRKKVKKQ
ncbi:hypothetical protein DFA_12269 [Cavenderia fasciculata]|uniref:Peptidase M16 C-terminal domain-containing protein n=1 Tax=Cavenderia fasciculata TaxID=261658 RepID=F4QCX0_CACFS|nr:uncharacterized protein DFA_12269 [Cavenderia fasciculata]EGG14494.1 hypothetical protein DFA_12269 [Cavenderia fasciculata]|eukprot:XP_004353903.1 hypothetical protein DFA_12269 [Cavenderia fasciculata]